MLDFFFVLILLSVEFVDRTGVAFGAAVRIQVLVEDVGVEEVVPVSLVLAQVVVDLFVRL